MRSFCVYVMPDIVAQNSLLSLVLTAVLVRDQLPFDQRQVNGDGGAMLRL